MNRTRQSKLTSTSDLWFQKNNYMAQFLSDKSIKIINKINKKYENANR
jgi:predicted transcriptional regulator